MTTPPTRAEFEQVKQALREYMQAMRPFNGRTVSQFGREYDAQRAALATLDSPAEQPPQPVGEETPRWGAKVERIPGASTWRVNRGVWGLLGPKPWSWSSCGYYCFATKDAALAALAACKEPPPDFVPESPATQQGIDMEKEADFLAKVLVQPGIRATMIAEFCRRAEKAAYERGRKEATGEGADVCEGSSTEDASARSAEPSAPKPSPAPPETAELVKRLRDRKNTISDDCAAADAIERLSRQMGLAEKILACPYVRSAALIHMHATLLEFLTPLSPPGVAGKEQTASA